MPQRENAVTVEGDVARVCVATRVYPGAVALVDAADIPIVIDGRGRWHARRQKRTLYAVRNVVLPDGRRGRQSLHRLLLPTALHIDHINRDGLDNRRANLREVTPRQNSLNSGPRGGESRFKGVSRYFVRKGRPTERWVATIGCLGEHRSLGHYATEEEAARVYDAEARRLFGAYAYTNFGDSA